MKLFLLIRTYTYGLHEAFTAADVTLSAYESTQNIEPLNCF